MTAVARGPAVKRVLSADPAFGGVERGGGDVEPTQGAGPCLEESELLEVESLLWVKARLEIEGAIAADILVGRPGGGEAFLRVAPGVDCIELLELRVRFCSEAPAKKALEAIDWPEVSRATIEGGCIELVVPADPLYRVVEALRRLGVKPPLAAEAYRLLERLEA